MHVLIADDDAVSLMVLTAALRKWGFTVTTADRGDTALDIFLRDKPRLAILDWMMPGLDGVEICRRVRREPSMSAPYIILLTGRVDRADVVTGLDAGADDYMVKPFHADELRARLDVARRLLEAKAENERLLESISSILIGLDAHGHITRWNAAARQAFGIEAAEAVGRPLTACAIRWADAAALEHALASRDEEVHLDNVRFSDDRGRERLLALTIASVQGEEGRIGQLLLGADVTDRRLLEAQLRQAQKLEGIGQLAAGIAHEINTPMQYIGDNVRFLGDSIKDLEPVFDVLVDLTAPGAAAAADHLAPRVAALAEAVTRADVDFIRRNLPDAVAQSLDGVAHVSRIVRAMKEFSHPGIGEKVPVDLNHAIETTVAVARNELKYVADLELALDPDLPHVMGLPGEINQVLLNLLVNAAHAVGEVVAATPGARGAITVATEPKDGVVEIRISDTGGGIPEAIRSRVFEPFFTTKDVGRGTGQGLALAHATVVNQHGGRIWFESVVGQGTTFMIQLPVAGVPASSDALVTPACA